MVRRGQIDPVAADRSVPAVTLTGLVGDEVYDVVKIDIEGAEYDALLNTRPEVLQRCRYVTMEFHASERLGDLVRHLTTTHSVTTLGRWDRGGYLYADAY